MNKNPVGWFEIYIQDVSRAKAFYEAVFQTKLTELKNPVSDNLPGMEMWAFPSSMENYGASGALVRMNGCASGGSTLVYFSCENCAIEAERAVSCGGEIFKEKMPIGEYGFIALIKDTEGNMIGLHSLR
jgi:predicted enzyme related to lactoylglutathione lyase